MPRKKKRRLGSVDRAVKWQSKPQKKNLPSDYFATAASVQVKKLKNRLNIDQPSMKSRTGSVMADGSGQGASWQMYVCEVTLAQKPS